MKKEFIITISCFVFMFFGGFALEAKAANNLYVTDTGDGVVNYEGCQDGCTLREAMRQADNGDTILFARPLFSTPQTIRLTSGHPLNLGYNGLVTINGENMVTIDGNNSTGIIYLSEGKQLNLWQMTLTNGRGADGIPGGIGANQATVNLYLVDINNCKSRVGGAISATRSTVNIDHSTLHNNSSTGEGSALYFYEGRASSITSSTISGNSSPSAQGAAIDLVSLGADLNILNSTITNNSANGGNSAGGIYNEAAAGCNSCFTALYIKSSIIAANPNVDSPNVSGHVNAQSYSLLSGNPLLLPLADNVDPSYSVHILTHAIDVCSPAINAGDPNANFQSGDQRFAPRVQQGRSDIGAYESSYAVCPASINVTNNNDSGAGSLRQAVNDIAPGGTISFPTGGADITLTSGEIAVLRDTNIGGNLSYPVTVRGNNQSRVFTVPSGKTLNLSKVILADGNAVGASGGAIVNNGTLNVTNSAIVNNKAQSDGGGIFNSGTLSMTNSTVSGNRVANKGAGIYNAVGATAGVNYVTISNNRSDGSAGAGVWDENFSGANFSARNSIIAGNISGNGAPVDYVGNLNGSSAYNLINTTVPLDPLSNYGGATLTHGLPNCASPAIDAADPNNGVATDQRGFARPFGGRADIGAFESTQSCSIVVQNGNPLGYGTLDQALADVLDGGRISFAPGVNSVYTFNGLGIYKNVTINVDPANPVTIQSNRNIRLLYIYSGVTANLTGLNFTGGNAVGGTGGAIQNNGTLNAAYINVYNNGASLGGGIFNNGTINLTNSTVRGNIGGGFLNNGALTLLNSTVSGNTGGGILNSATLRLVNSTVSGNQSNGKGAGVYNNGGGNILVTVINSTITDNRGFGYTGAGVWNDNGSDTFRVRNSIIDGNFSDQGYAHDYVGGLTNQGNNLIGTRNPGLAPLGNYGGATQTHALLQTSPALDAGNNCVLTANGCADNNPALTTDERGTGAPRKIGSAVDVGAFERSITFNQSTLPNGSAGASYNQTLTVARQTNFARSEFDKQELERPAAPFTFSIISIAGQQLPPGLTLASDGTLSGTPTMSGSYTFTVKAIDADAMAGAQQFTLQIAAAPTAAPISISGTVVTPNQTGLMNALVTLTDSHGDSRTVFTGKRGSFFFTDVATGGTYIISVQSKRYVYPPQIVSAIEDLSGLVFAPQ